MFLGAQDRVVMEESVEHIKGRADGPGEHRGVEHTVLVRGVRIDRQGLLVGAEGARSERAEQGTGLQPKALAIGRRDRPVTPDVDGAGKR